MSLSSSASNSAPDLDAMSENSEDSYDSDINSSDTHWITSVVDNKVYATCSCCGLVQLLPILLQKRELKQEVDQEITSHPTEDSQPAESHQVASPPKPIEGGKAMAGTSGLKEKRKSSDEISASPRKKKVAAEISASPEKKKVDP